MHPFLASLLGGVLVGVAASLMLLLSGRVAGVSGILSGAVLARQPGERGWRIAFVAGMIAVGAVLAQVSPASFGSAPGRGGLGLMISAGLLVGLGTSLASGCTSGHGVCGVSRLSPRSLAATATFIATGVATVALMRLLGVVS